MAWVVSRTDRGGAKRFVACYRDPEGRQRSAGTYSTHRAALRAANRQEQRVLAGQWHDHSRGTVRFRDYVENDWLPSKHLEPTTLASYSSNLTKHFFPFFGRKQLTQITPALVQDWVTQARAGGLSPRSIRKYHTMLHSIFVRAVRDQVVTTNPCAHTDLPKVVATKTRTLTPEEYEQLIAAIPDGYRLLVETAIETGMRWGELIALKPRHIDFLRRTLTVQDTIIEVSKKHSPTGERYVAKAYPKDNEPRTFAVRQNWLDAIADHIQHKGLGREDLLFTTQAGTPISRNTFRTRVWQPAVAASGIDFAVRMHDLRHAHASWLLAGGSDLKSVMDRLGHAHIQTTQKYLHALAEADQRNLDALDKMTRSQPDQGQ
jgi:site-specific recombinase XerD